MANVEGGWRLAVGGLAVAASAVACTSVTTEAPPPPPSATASPSNGTEFPPGTVLCNPNTLSKADQVEPVVFTCPNNVKVDTTPLPELGEADINVFSGRKLVSAGSIAWDARTPISFPGPKGETVFVSTTGGGIAVGLLGGPNTAYAEGIRQNRQSSKPL